MSVRHMLLALVAACVLPMLMLVFASALYRGHPGLLVLGIIGVAGCTLMVAWRVASLISDSLELLSAAVRAAGDDEVWLPRPRFKEELHLGQSFLYATTALHDAHKSLRGREACLRTVLDSARDAIVTTDEDGHIVLFNHAAERMFGIDEEQALGSGIERLLPAQYRGQHLASMRELTPDSPRRMGPARVVRAVHVSGEMFPVAASISCGSDGERRFYTAILREVAEGRLDIDVTAALPVEA